MNAAPDDLTQPLGLPGERCAPRLRIPVAPVLGAALAAALAAFGGAVLFIDDPFGGEPYAVAAIETRPAAVDVVASREGGAPPAGEAASGPRQRNAAEVEQASAVAVVRADGTAAPDSLVIQVQDAPVRLNPAPDQRLIERTRQGLLPRIGPDGARPADVYARPAGALPGRTRPAARIAILVGGLGISQSATTDAIGKLPPAVTLAFAPYGGKLEQHATRAREEGHEIMVQVPMEPFDYPDNDPGPHTLIAGAKPQDNLERLHWVMARIGGYVGLVNFMGAKLTGDEAALAPILREVGGRGLFFLDDGSSSRSLVAVVGHQVRAPTLRADAVLDGVPRADAIDGELAKVEEVARKRGLAVASASALPLTVERIARWARTLEQRDILLVPVSAAFGTEGRS